MVKNYNAAPYFAPKYRKKGKYRTFFAVYFV